MVTLHRLSSPATRPHAVQRWALFAAIVGRSLAPDQAQAQEPLPAAAEVTPVVAPTLAPSAADERYELGEVAVGRKRRAPPSTEQRVDERTLAPLAAHTANELMRLVPGAHVPMNSRGEQFVFLRDAGERQVAVFLDGAQLMVPWDYAIDLGMVPAGLIGGLAVVKGASSVLWGANVIGGAVNLLTREQRGQGMTTDAGLSGGVPGRWAGQVAHVGRSGQWSWSSGAQYSANDNQPLANTALSNPRSALYSNGALTDTRNNSSSQQLSGMLRGAYQGDSGARLAVTLLHLDADKDVPPQGNLDPTKNTVRYWRYPLWQNTMVIVSGELPYGETGNPSTLKATAWLQRFAQTIDSYKNADFADGTQKAKQSDQDLTIGARLALDHVAGPGTVRLVLNELYSTHEQTDYACKGTDCTASLPSGATTTDTARAVQTYSQNILSTGAEYEASLLDKRLNVRVGGGYDMVAMQDIGAFAAKGTVPTYGDWSGLAAARYSLAIEGLSVRGAVARKTRFPTQRELYGAALGKFLPNPDLRPESALLSELGLAFDSPLVHGEATAFYADSRDTLDKHTVSVDEGGKTVKKDQRYNLKGAHILGVEAAAQLRPWRDLALGGHLTLVDAKAYDPTTGDYTGHLQRRPVATGLAMVGWAPAEGPQVLVQAVISGGAYSADASGAVTRLDGATLLGARLGWKVRLAEREGEVFARIDNVLNTLYLPTDGFPEPGRVVTAGVRARF